MFGLGSIELALVAYIQIIQALELEITGGPVDKSIISLLVQFLFILDVMDTFRAEELIWDNQIYV